MFYLILEKKRDFVILFSTNFLKEIKLFSSKNESFLIGNKKSLLLAKIDIKESVIAIVKTTSTILLRKYSNLNNINCILVIVEFLLKRS